MLEGNNICLRAIEQTDLSLLQRWRNSPSLRKNFREFRELSLDDQQHWFEKFNNHSDTLMFVIETMSEGKSVGVCGITHIDWHLRSAELSVYIGMQDKYIDDVFAPEAVGVLLDYAFNELNLHKIWGEIYEFDNLKIHLFQKEFGFHLDGLLRDNCFTEGCYHNSLVVSLLADEWSV